MDDHEECQSIQEENTTASGGSEDFCCSNFIQIKNFEELSRENSEELEDTQGGANQVSSFTTRPGMRFEALDFSDFTSPKPSLEHAPSLELKPLPSHLKYVYLGSNETLPVIISSKLLHNQECSLINLLSQYKKAIGWTMAGLKGINPTDRGCAQLDYCSVGFNFQCFYFFYCGCFNNLPRQDDKGDVSAETTGPAWAVAWANDQISVEHLVVLWLISKSSN
ncbi:hypothetical protein V6N12_023400 [Hibiscus sabdariffa]|uniref:Uncharacterized protein n=1 Tax=Hibiscus sabdariffa TaxID=183260 RepID=A0ABR2FYH6_9ROSI